MSDKNLVRAWYSVFILLLAFVFSFIDRIILSLLVGPVKADLGVSDTAMGFLMGLAFAIFYTLLGIPIARLADRYSRRMIIGIGIFLWSIATAVCGLARNYWELLAARIGVGVGEAALSPAAYSLIADLFPKDKIGRAISVYQSGAFLGAGIAFLVGGAVIGFASKVETLTWPLVGVIKPWQAAFIIVGLPGILMAFAMATIREPARRGSGGRQDNSMPVSEVIGFIWSHRKAYIGHFLGFALLSVPITVVFTWSPTFMGRTLGIPPTEFGKILGFMLLTLSPAGVLAGGWLSDFLLRRGYKDAPLRVGLIAAAALIPLTMAAHLNDSYATVVGFYCPWIFFASLPIGTAPAALQLITPNPMRAQTSAFYMLSLNLLTAAIGPLGIGLANDYLFQAESAIGQSIVLVSCISLPIGAAFVLWARRTFAALNEPDE